MQKSEDYCDIEGGVVMGGGCSNNPIGMIVDKVKDFFCSDYGCGYHPGPSENELHAQKIANELAEMKKNIRESSEKTEEAIVSYVTSSLEEFLKQLEVLNHNRYGGKQLNINISVIQKKNNDLKNQVKGHIGSVMDSRLVLTDKELSVILEERNDEKRDKNFDAFVDKVYKEAIDGLYPKIENAVTAQSEMVQKEINNRVNDVEKQMQNANKEYTAIMNERQNGVKASESIRFKNIYRCGLYDILLEQLE